MPPLFLNFFRGLENLLLQGVVFILDVAHSFVQICHQLLLHHHFFLGSGNFFLEVLDFLICFLADLFYRLSKLLFHSLDLVLKLSDAFL